MDDWLAKRGGAVIFEDVKALLPLLFFISPLAAQDEPVPPSEVEEINADQLRIGTVLVDKRTREVSFPAVVNMAEGLLELAVVHVNGKLHESLFSTETRPVNVNIGLKLMGYPGSDELFEILEEDYRPTGKFPEIPAEIREKSRLDVFVEWPVEGKVQRMPLTDLIYHEVLEGPMPRGPWLYTGSYMLRGAFKAEISGDIISIYLFQSALINFPGDDRNSDEVWIPNPKTVPPVDTPVTIVIAERKEE